LGSQRLIFQHENRLRLAATKMPDRTPEGRLLQNPLFNPTPANPAPDTLHQTLTPPVPVLESAPACDHRSCLTRVEFDSAAFSIPYFRVVRFDELQLREEIAALATMSPVVADCKVSAGDVATSHWLMRLGFRKICMQITLRHNLEMQAPALESDATIAGKLDLDDDTMWAHARNFRQDRFSLDPLLPAEGRHRLYYQWLRNSLGGARQVAHRGRGICSFSKEGEHITIDLVSVLEKGRGNGARLVNAVIDYARRSGASDVRVTTECENTTAWNLYQRLGFVTETFTSVFHLVSLP